MTNKQKTWGGKREGAGRKPKYGSRSTQITISIPPILKTHIDNIRGDESRSEYITHLLSSASGCSIESRDQSEVNHGSV